MQTFLSMRTGRTRNVLLIGGVDGGGWWKKVGLLFINLVVSVFSRWVRERRRLFLNWRIRGCH